MAALQKDGSSPMKKKNAYTPAIGPRVSALPQSEAEGRLLFGGVFGFAHSREAGECGQTRGRLHERRIQGGRMQELMSVDSVGRWPTFPPGGTFGLLGPPFWRDFDDFGHSFVLMGLNLGD